MPHAHYELQLWPHRPPPAGASVWVDRIQRWHGPGEIAEAFVPAFFGLMLLESGTLHLSGDRPLVLRGPHLIRLWPRESVALLAQTPVRLTRLRFRGVGLPALLASVGLSRERLARAPEQPARVAKAFAELRTLYAQSDRSPLSALAKLYALVAACAADTTPVRDAGVGRELVEEALALMEAELSSTPSMAELARALHVSDATLLRLFRRHHGSSPIQALTTLRLRRARDLLARTDLKVAAIADRCGFRSATYFHRCFARAFKRSPGAYRSEQQGPIRPSCQE